MKIIPHLEDGNFTSSGELWITFDCKEPTDKIILNAREITFDQIEINSLVKHVSVVNFTVISRSEVVLIKLDNPLRKDVIYKLYIRFTGILNDVLQGFYRSSYVDSATKETRYILIRFN